MGGWQRRWPGHAVVPHRAHLVPWPQLPAPAQNRPGGGASVPKAWLRLQQNRRHRRLPQSVRGHAGQVFARAQEGRVRRRGKGRHASRLCSVCFRLLVELRQGFVRLAEWHRPTKPPNFCSCCVSVHVLRVGAAPAVACCSSPALRFPLSRPLRDETPKYPDFLSFSFPSLLLTSPCLLLLPSALPPSFPARARG